jgi:pSer/pThr/pTyr-binding forkhead associated (FHA) protein
VSEPRCWLVPVHGGAPIELSKPLTLVGRQDHCDLELDHKTISKLHCILLRSDGAVLLRDLGSTNGCRINGQKMKTGAVLPNDVLSIAVFDFRLFLGDELPGSTPITDKTEMIDLSQLAALDGPDLTRAKDELPSKGGYQLRE